MLEDVPVFYTPAEFDTFLSDLGTRIRGEQIHGKVLSQYAKRGAIRGFACSVSCPDGQQRYLDILFTPSFPKVLPLVAIRDTALHLQIPHVESDGVLCLPTAGKSYNGSNILRQTIGIFREAIELIQASKSETWKAAHFKAEFTAYWANRIGDNGPTIRARVTPKHQSGLLFSIRTQRGIYIADSRASLEEFTKRQGVAPYKDDAVKEALLLCLPGAPTPKEMPRSAECVCKLIEQFAAEHLAALEAQFRKSPEAILVVIQVPQGQELAYGGLLIPGRKQKNYARHSRQRVNGFRAGREPPAMLRKQYFSPQKLVQYLQIIRFDDAVIRSRESNSQPPIDLQNCSVAVVGCGSVGSSVADILAQSGVGRLALVDHEVLGPENLSRNTLGATSVGFSKAKELETRLLRDRPQLQSVTAIAERIDRLTTDHWNQLVGVDCVLFSIGQSGMEIYAAEMLRRHGFSGIIGHAWLEPFACAGHLLLSPDQQVTRQDQTDEMGDPLDPVTCWEGVDVERDGGGCGDTYQPYGAAALTRATSMIASGVIEALITPPATTAEHIVTSSTSELKRNGGTWSKHWLSESRGRPGGVQITRDYPFPLAAVSGE